MAFLAFNPSSSAYAEYLLAYVGPFGAGETAQGLVKRIPSVTSRTERNCGITSPRVETVYFPLTTFLLMVICAYLATLVSQGFSHIGGSQCGPRGKNKAFNYSLRRAHSMYVQVQFISEIQTWATHWLPVPEPARSFRHHSESLSPLSDWTSLG
jgi:hypothetical protein